MQLNEAIRLRLKQLRDENALTNYKISCMAGARPSQLNDFLTGRISYPRLDTFYFLCQGMGISLSDFFDDPLFNEENIDIIDEKD